MTNADTPFGFRPIGADGGPYNGVTRRAVLAAGDGTATFIGDAVKLAGTSINGSPTIAQCVAGDPVYGVVTSFEASPETSLEDQYRKASTERYCQVALADNAFFVVQENGPAIGIASVGLNADFIVAAGSTVTGLSAMELDSGTEATTSSLDLQIVEGVFRDDNDLTLTNAEWIVKFNDPQGKPVRTGV